MTFKKYGLGRGLEALLADTTAKEINRDERQSSPIIVDTSMLQASDENTAVCLPSMGVDLTDAAPSINELMQKEQSMDSLAETTQANIAGGTEAQTAMVVALFKNIQRENLVLILEAEVLRQLLDDLESIVRADLSKTG